MPKPLPARPNLEHLRTQAKSLLGRLREGDAKSARILIDHLPEAAGLTPRQIRDRGFRLADAQLAIARKSGFAAWPSLARHVSLLRSLEGVWTFSSLEVDAQSMPAAMLSHSKLLIDGDRFRMESPEANYEGIFNIDVDVTPHRIDIDFVEGPEAGNRSEGIFELDGDHLRICLGFTGANRPERFATTKGSGHALEELVRVEHARPAGVSGGTPPPPEPSKKKAAASSAAEANSFDSPLTPTLEKLQGEWTPLELVTSGSPLETAFLSYGVRTHTGVETKVVFGGQTMLHSKVRVHEGTPPLEIDYLHLAGKDKGAVSLGLFRWDGDIAVFCIAPAGSPRPADFSCAPKSGRTFSRWQRRP